MLNEADIEEAVRRYKNMRLNGHERVRYHALLLVSKGYSYRETGRILLVDEETVSRWVRQYELGGLDNLKNAPDWGGEHGQRELNSGAAGA
jgi:transposase